MANDVTAKSKADPDDSVPKRPDDTPPRDIELSKRASEILGVILALPLILVVIWIWSHRSDEGYELLLTSVGLIFIYGPVVAVTLTFLASFRLKQSAVALQAFGVPEVVVVLKRFFDAVKGAPLWLALAAAGVGLIVLGSLYGGYRFAAGGITNIPAPTAVAAPTPTQTPIPETST